MKKLIVGNNGNVTSKFRKVKLTYAEVVKCNKTVQMQDEYIGEEKDPLNSVGNGLLTGHPKLFYVVCLVLGYTRYFVQC